jgi:transposase
VAPGRIAAAKQHNANAFHRLRSVPGIGKVLALTILYEIHDIARFDRVQEFASYARLVKGRKTIGRQDARHQWRQASLQLTDALR